MKENGNPLVNATWLNEHLNHPNIVVLDASPSDNKSNLKPVYTDIQIPNARVFDMENVFVDQYHSVGNMIPKAKDFEKLCRKLGINKDSQIVVYDNLGIYTSPRAWWMFKVMGHEQIAVLDGGLPAWINNGFPSEARHNKTYTIGDFKANYQKAMVRNSSFMLENCETDQALVLDARSEGRFTGIIPEPRSKMESGHIPNSMNLPYNAVLNDGFMKSKSELEHIFSTLMIQDGNKELVFTCGSGITACIILLACELIYDNTKSLFDGSWSEWGQEGKFPVAKE